MSEVWLTEEAAWIDQLPLVKVWNYEVEKHVDGSFQDKTQHFPLDGT